MARNSLKKRRHSVKISKRKVPRKSKLTIKRGGKKSKTNSKRKSKALKKVQSNSRKDGKKHFQKKARKSKRAQKGGGIKLLNSDSENLSSTVSENTKILCD